jgi:hypothetical protein
MTDTDERIATAPLPTARTLRMRTNLLVQAWRFVVVNLRMARMIRRSHHPTASLTPTHPRPR